MWSYSSTQENLRIGFICSKKTDKIKAQIKVELFDSLLPHKHVSGYKVSRSLKKMSGNSPSFRGVKVCS